MTTDTAVNARLLSLLPRIQSTAKCLDTAPDIELGDLVNNMCLRIMERAQSIPGSLEQKDAYLVIDAYYNTMHLRESAQVYRKYNQSEMVVIEDEDEQDPVSFFETIATSEINPEDALVYSEMADEIRERVQQLSPECVELIRYSVSGLNDSQIAEKVGVSKAAISQRRITIRKALAGIR